MQDDTPNGWAAVAAGSYIALGTYRRSGVLVTTPVWVASVGPAMVVTTEPATGKVKRLRNDPRVVIRPCSARGRVNPGAVTLHARCEIIAPDGDQRDAVAALRRKYGLQYSAVQLVERVIRGVQRKHPERVILRITP